MTRRQAFTDTTIRNLTAGSISDPLTAGLSIDAKDDKRSWRYYRRLRGSDKLVRLVGGSYPAVSIKDARQWAETLNLAVDAGVDLREQHKAAKAAAMTLSEAWQHYWTDVSAGTRKLLKPRTLADKRAVWTRDIQPHLGERALSSITADDLWSVVERKADTAPVRANRLAAEIKVIWSWFTSRAGQRMGIEADRTAAASLTGTHYAESGGRTRILSDDEIVWLLQSLTSERPAHRRAITLLLLSGCRFAEVVEAPLSQYRDGVWTIAGKRTKNGKAHAIALGQYGRSLVAEAQGEWLVPSMTSGLIEQRNWYHVRDRVHARMERIAKRPIDRWGYHDLRRTLRSNTFRLGIQYEVAEAMLNHTRQGLERRYDVGDLSAYTADGFAKWERHVVSLMVA